MLFELQATVLNDGKALNDGASQKTCQHPYFVTTLSEEKPGTGGFRSTPASTFSTGSL
jgi:hypothetical protein